MQKETWNKFRTEAYLRKLNLNSVKDSYDIKKIFWEKTWIHHPNHTKMWWKAVRFIEKLLVNKVSLHDIEINDFESAWPCRVYVRNRSYTRFAKNDYKLVLKYLKVED